MELRWHPSHTIRPVNSGSTGNVPTPAAAQSSDDPSGPRQRYTLRQRILLQLITWSCYLAIRLIGPDHPLRRIV